MSHDLGWFWDGFEEIADAPNGVARLRELILSLAVRGRLVPQNEGDEPASALLGRVAGEKANNATKRRLIEPLTALAEDEAPFGLPESWLWVRLGEVTDIVRGITFPSSAKTLSSDPNAVACLRTSNVQDTVETHDLLFVPRTYVKNPEQWLRPNDLVISMANSKELVGKIAIAEPLNFDCSFGGFLSVIRVGELNPRFMFLMFRSPQILGAIRATSSQTVNIANISLGGIRPLPIPLPPLAEQERIVAKVDELMALCDELETRQKEKRAGRVVALNACLHRLGQAADADEFETRLETLADHFEELLDAPESVAPLRAAILGLAVRGKLESQNEGDEPASALLERIAVEKAELIAQKKIRKGDPLPPIDAEQVPFEIPASWEWCHVGDVSMAVDYGTSQKSFPVSIGVPVLGMGHIQNGKVLLDNLKRVPDNIEDLPRLLLEENDVLFNRTNSFELVGKTGIFKGQSGCFTFASYLIRLSLAQGVDPHYINLAMNSSYFRQTQIEPYAVQQCGQANFNGTKLKESLIPLPSLAEQKRIVARVDRLMALCDELELRLNERQQGATRLASGAVAAMSA